MVTISGLWDHIQKLSENCTYALVATRKRQAVLERLLQTRSTFSKSVMVSMGVSKLGSIDLMFINARVKISGAYYREVLLIQKLMPVMRKICGEFFIFQQGNVPAHRACETINLLKRDTCVYFTRPFSTNSTDLNPVHYRNMGINATAAGIASSWCRWTEAVLNRCLASLGAKRLRWLSWSVAQMSLRMNLREMKTFRTFNLTPLTHVLFCTSCLVKPEVELKAILKMAWNQFWWLSWIQGTYNYASDKRHKPLGLNRF